MKTKILLLTLLMATTLITPVLAKGPTKKAGMSDVQLLYLFKKDYEDPEWPVIEGAWGKIQYNVVSGDFVFNGHGLDAGTDYTLINFARVHPEWPATINELGTGTANGGGNVHIAGNIPYASLGEDTTPGSKSGVKIWLVLSSDIDGDGKLAGWNPANYLFEADTI